ncbi:hypothetical protein G6F57_023171 [Rhizopus arrhizus]|nr:hypothetical protein G6F40_016055 [Rhizopus arrhizus]KAG1377246.1 hypothetical protein G6F59_018195 [Rhizopus arrhizus]KAG1428911.1 hypothetical protein G6F57_023171 [Rhizopus arrhizus]
MRPRHPARGGKPATAALRGGRYPHGQGLSRHRLQLRAPHAAQCVGRSERRGSAAQAGVAARHDGRNALHHRHGRRAAPARHPGDL